MAGGPFALISWTYLSAASSFMSFEPPGSAGAVQEIAGAGRGRDLWDDRLSPLPPDDLFNVFFIQLKFLNRCA